MSDSKSDSLEFDKFMDEIIVKEETSKRRKEETAEEITPQREYARRYRELPQNRVKFGR